jgi:tetratricopeptide (TPR) repeat protein
VDRAVADFTKVVELDGKQAPAHDRLAWYLATCADLKLRDPRRAVAAARKALELAPKQGYYWHTLAWAEYRAGNWKAALSALEKVKELGSAGHSFEWFLRAMVHYQLGDHDQARRWYDSAIKWMDNNLPTEDELRRFRAEAAELLKIKKGQ